MLKRSYFKKKPTVPMKRSKLKSKCKLKKQSKQKISTIQVKLWSLCKQIIRKTYGPTCYTCGRTGLIGSNWHTGHLWAKASLGAYLKYDLRVLRSQCYNCNINLGGMGAEFYRRMFIIEGQEYIEKLVADRQVSVNAYDHYQKLLTLYQQTLERLSNLLSN